MNPMPPPDIPPSIQNPQNASPKAARISLNQSFGVEIARPGNDGLDRTVEVALRGAANRAHIAGPQIREDLVEDLAAGFDSGGPLGVERSKVPLGDHLEDRPHVLRHAAVHQDQALLQTPACFVAHFRMRKDAMIGQQSAAADAELRDRPRRRARLRSA